MTFNRDEADVSSGDYEQVQKWVLYVEPLNNKDNGPGPCPRSDRKLASVGVFALQQHLGS